MSNENINCYRSYDEQMNILNAINIDIDDNTDDSDIKDIKNMIYDLLHEKFEEPQMNLEQKQEEKQIEDKSETDLGTDLIIDLTRKKEVMETRVKYLKKKIELKKMELEKLNSQHNQRELKFITSLRGIRDKLVKKSSE